jgi:hypothetical protein
MMRKAGLVVILIASLAAIFSYLPHSAISDEKPPGAPTDQDPKAYHGLTDKNIEHLKNGEVVILKSPEDLFGRKLIVAAMIMNQDIDTVWDLLTQPWRQEEYQRGLQRSELIEKSDESNLVDFHIKVVTIDIDYRMRHTNDSSEYFVHWKLDPDYENDMKEAMGFYRFYWIDENHTLIRYGTVAELKIFIPPKIQVFITKQAIPDALKAAKKWVDSKGTYRKKGYEPPKNL